MKTFFRLLGYSDSLIGFLIPYLITSILASVFGLLNFALIIPLLNVLFRQTSELNDPETLVLPEFSFSIDYGIDLFHYQFNTFVQQHGSLGALKFVCAVVVISVLFSNIFRYLSVRQLENFKVNMVANIRQAVFNNASSLHLGYFSNQRKGNLISRILTDVQEVENSVANTLGAAFKELPTLIVYLFALFKISTSLTLFAFLIIPVSGTFIAVMVKKMRKEARDGQNRLSGLISLMDEVFGGMRIIKAFNAESLVQDRFKKENMAYKRSIRSMAFKREMSSPFSEFMGVTVVAIILLYGGSMVLTNSSELSASEFIFYIATFSQVMRPAKEITNAFGNTQRGIAAGERVFELLDKENEVKSRKNPSPIERFRNGIKFENVCFEYEPGKTILNNISFEIPKGKTVALVGSSGGGKSTIADLLPRFYDPVAGRILVDENDLKDLDLFSVRELMGIVTQEPILFNDSIYNNISFGIHATEEQVFQAARIANAHEFIMEQPEGYETIIGDRGTKLSGGQKQRISIARAILKNPPILILDEATSALDTESEKLVQEALSKLMKNRTVLVIAHRLSTIQHADEILVIHQGEIIERGTHDQLMKVDHGLYHKLTTMQTL